MDYKRLLDIVINMGKEMLICGAEVSRVEDTIRRICQAYDADETDVFTITSSIVITIKADSEIYTQTKRITAYKTNLDRLDKLNTLSRYICNNKPEISYIENACKSIEKSKNYGFMANCIIYCIIAFSLTLFFGGSLFDGIVSGVLGIIIYLLLAGANHIDVNALFITMVTAFTVGTAAVIAVKLGFGKNLDSIIIGNIMLLIPGVAITNSIRDMISGDTMSGLLRFVEAIIKAVFVALGFVFATVYLGGIIL